MRNATAATKLTTARANIRAAANGGIRTGLSGMRDHTVAPVTVYCGPAAPTSLPRTLAGIAPVPHPEPKADPLAAKLAAAKAQAEAAELARQRRRNQRAAKRNAKAAAQPVAAPVAPARTNTQRPVIAFAVVATTSAAYPFAVVEVLSNLQHGKRVARSRSKAAALVAAKARNVAHGVKVV